MLPASTGNPASHTQRQTMVSHAHDSPELARTYDRISDSQLEAGQRLVERLALTPGERVLDIGCGTGRLAEWIAGRIGPNVVGIDPLPERIALARARAPALRFEVGRAEQLGEFPDAGFDAVCLSAVLHWVEDKARALGEIARVLRPGGRLGITTRARELDRQSTIAEVLGSLVRTPPYRQWARQVPGAKQAATLTEMVSLLRGAALDVRELHVVQRRQRHERGADVVDFFDSSAFGNFLSFVPEEVRGPLRAELVNAFDARRGPEGILIRDYGVLIVADRR